MIISNTILKNIIAVAKEIYSQQSQADLNALRQHFGETYKEIDAMSTIAVEIALRVYGVLDFSTRTLTPLSMLAEEGAARYKERFSV